MTIFEIFGYFGALLIGLVLGLIGGGGSILTVPILVYLFGISPLLATAYSLFVVGTTAFVGTLRNIPKKLVDFKTATLFAIPAFLAVYICRRFIVHAIPNSIAHIGEFELSKNLAIMLFFAFLMGVASISMIRNKREDPNEKVRIHQPFFLMLIGLFVGFLTGMVGAGGGFLIIPALVLFAKLPMKKAVATSLLIIAVNSLIGFTGDLQNFDLNWSFLIIFASLSIVGIFIGITLNKFIDGKKLKKGFGWFVLMMAIYILFRELVF